MTHSETQSVELTDALRAALLDCTPPFTVVCAPHELSALAKYEWLEKRGYVEAVKRRRNMHFTATNAGLELLGLPTRTQEKQS